MEIRNDYTDDDNFTHIDYWENDDDTADGRTIAIVCLDTQKVYFIDNAFRRDDEVKKAIQEVLDRLNVTPALRAITEDIKMGQIPERALVYGIEKNLAGREAYKDADEGLNEAIYYGSVFEDMLQDDEDKKITLDVKAKLQIVELVSFVKANQYSYIQIARV